MQRRREIMKQKAKYDPSTHAPQPIPIQHNENDASDSPSAQRQGVIQIIRSNSNPQNVRQPQPKQLQIDRSKSNSHAPLKIIEKLKQKEEQQLQDKQVQNEYFEEDFVVEANNYAQKQKPIQFKNHVLSSIQQAEKQEDNEDQIDFDLFQKPGTIIKGGIFKKLEHIENNSNEKQQINVQSPSNKELAQMRLQKIKQQPNNLQISNSHEDEDHEDGSYGDSEDLRQQEIAQTQKLTWSETPEVNNTETINQSSLNEQPKVQNDNEEEEYEYEYEDE
ncbi:Hypothetical_protein [Hexamita inflata]|uniref:Hypothetical_protein n=1 Tax=Hexamita inflata TaxID=28002 RepID=A0AA86QAB0_9EUKA|nr:Hypothetical protein HINF_LOCUS39368 [Hexamita inflata]